MSCAIDTTCGINIPIHVATQGFLDRALGVATHGWLVRFDSEITVEGGSNIPPNNIGSLIGDPRREWWVRMDPTDPLYGPLSFRDADKAARFLSAEGNPDGKAEIVTFLGDRSGDPLLDEAVLFVAFMYDFGKRSLAGRMAEYNSGKEAP